MKPLTIKTLKLLRAAGERGLLNHELAPHVGHRYSARIDELRKAGCTIEKAHVKGGMFRYWLRSEPSGFQPSPTPAAPALLAGPAPTGPTGEQLGLGLVA